MASFRAAQAIRHFSTSSVRHKLVQPPIKIHGIPGSYASALYSAASKGKQLEQVEKEMNAFQGLLDKDVRFREFLLDPSQKRKLKLEALDGVLKKLKYSSITTNLFATMAENSRLRMTNEVMKAFRQIMTAHRGEVVITVTTAQALDSGSQKELQTSLQGFAKKGQKMDIVMKVDPSLLGGMTVNIGGDRFIDMSTATKIKNYKGVLEQSI